MVRGSMLETTTAKSRWAYLFVAMGEGRGGGKQHRKHNRVCVAVSENKGRGGGTRLVHSYAFF